MKTIPGTWDRHLRPDIEPGLLSGCHSHSLHSLAWFSFLCVIDKGLPLLLSDFANFIYNPGPTITQVSFLQINLHQLHSKHWLSELPKQMVWGQCLSPASILLLTLEGHADLLTLAPGIPQRSEKNKNKRISHPFFWKHCWWPWGWCGFEQENMGLGEEPFPSWGDSEVGTGRAEGWEATGPV